MDKFQIQPPSLISINDTNDMGAIKNNQIYSMFNNLQCQLMTLQSTMVSLQMNQNILQSTVEGISKSVGHITGKIDDIHSYYGYNAVDGTVSTTTVLENVESKEPDSADSEVPKKKKKKKHNTESTEESECSELKRKRRTKSFNVSHCLSDLKSDQNVKPDFGIFELQSDLIANPVIEISEGKCPKKEKKKVKNPKKEKINIDEIESKGNDSDVLVVTEDLESKPEGKTSRNRKRKRNRRKKSIEMTVHKTLSPQPSPKVVTMNLPNSQQPNNTKITFDSDSDNESKIVSKTKNESRNSSSFNEVVTSTPMVTTYQEMVPSKWNDKVKSSQKKMITQNKENRSNNKSSASPVVSTKFGTKQRHKSLVIADVLNKIRYEADSNDLDNEVNDDNSVIIENVSEASPKINPFKNINESKAEKFIAIPVKDYNIYPILSGPPRKGDQIAYKILELSEDYNPVLSAYKEAEVLSFDSDSNILHIKLNEPVQLKQELGKFDLPTDETDYNLDQIEVNWKEMIEPRLLPIQS